MDRPVGAKLTRDGAVASDAARDRAVGVESEIIGPNADLRAEGERLHRLVVERDAHAGGEAAAGPQRPLIRESPVYDDDGKDPWIILENGVAGSADADHE